MAALITALALSVAVCTGACSMIGSFSSTILSLVTLNSGEQVKESLAESMRTQALYVVAALKAVPSLSLTLNNGNMARAVLKLSKDISEIHAELPVQPLVSTFEAVNDDAVAVGTTNTFVATYPDGANPAVQEMIKSRPSNP